MVPVMFQYTGSDLAARARTLIGTGQVFAFRVTGEARRQLQPFVSGHTAPEPAKLGAKPRLQPLVAILSLAEGHARPVSFDVDDDEIRVWVGVGRA